MDVPAGLGERGADLWNELASGDASNDVLVLEAARLADRCDELDNVIQGKGVLNLMQFRVLDREVEDDTLNLWVEVKFQHVLSEARQQQLALANVMAKLGGAAKQADSKPVSGTASGSVTPLQMLMGDLEGA